MPRTEQIESLARVMIGHSLAVKAGETILIEYDGQAGGVQAQACAEEVIKAGGTPILQNINIHLRRAMLKYGTETQLQRWGEIFTAQMDGVDGYMDIRGYENLYEINGTPAEGQRLFSTLVAKPVLKSRFQRKWVVTRYPNAAMSQLAEQSTEDFANYYFKVCCVDYAAMDRAAQPLKALMDRTDKVQIKGPRTDLTFSIKGLNSVICAGTMNIPDGECFTAPVRDSLNGTVLFNCKTLDRESGEAFSSIHITFKDGKAVGIDAGSPDKSAGLTRILTQDDGASYLGEFALGFNPHIHDPINDILFDEKINGSFHMAFGQAYDEAFNGNNSKLHWDLIQIQRPEYGGGEIWFDDVLIRKDGLFVVQELVGLNPDRLG